MEVSIFHFFLSSLVIQYQTFSFKQTTAAVGGRKRKELKKKKQNMKKKKANAKLLTERERVICVRQNVSAIRWGAWWCGTSTKFLNFQFFYCCVQVSPRCVGKKIRIFFPFIRWGNCWNTYVFILKMLNV